MLQVQFQRIKGNDVGQFTDISTQVVITPMQYKSGEMIILRQGQVGSTKNRRRGEVLALGGADETVLAAVLSVRPGDPGWPPNAVWEELNLQVEGRLMKVQSPLIACFDAPSSAASPITVNDRPEVMSAGGRGL